MDIHDKAVGQRNLVERIAAKIPGFKGYLNKELRRDTDKLHREFVANKLRGLKDEVKRALNERISGGDIDGITPFEKLMNRLDAVGARILTADRGYSGVFDAVKVGEAELERIYQFDLSLTEGAEEIEKKIKTFESVDKETQDKLVKEATKLVNQVDEYFDKREEILRKGA